MKWSVQVSTTMVLDLSTQKTASLTHCSELQESLGTMALLRHMVPSMDSSEEMGGNTSNGSGLCIGSIGVTLNELTCACVRNDDAFCINAANALERAL